MSGFPDLDECLGGLQRAGLVILGARPSMGKSSLAVNMAINAAQSGQTCGVFSLEMTREQLAMRILASEAEIDSHRLRLGLYYPLGGGPGSSTPSAVCPISRCSSTTPPTRAWSRCGARPGGWRLDQGLDLLVVDYLQLGAGEASDGGSPTGCRR